MPEGHSVHRHAKALAEAFLGTPVKVTSPQGRFSSGAKRVSGRKLVRSTAIGKQLFLEFDNALVIRIHLGIYGKWNFHEIAGQDSPELWGQVRARFSNGTHLADLRGPTVCEVLTISQAEEIVERLGPDPLNKTALRKSADKFVALAGKSQTPIAALLMNQTVISGIGNVYRAELLFRAKLNPLKPGASLSREELLGLWRDAVKLMPLGVKTGIMLTRNGFLRAGTAVEDRHYVYKRAGAPCRECGTEIAMRAFAGRKLYWCPSCQA